MRRYSRDAAIVFLKTRDEFGGLSNMAAGFPLRVNGTEIRTSEALYQASRFPHLAEVQRQILAQRSPMTAKMKSKPHRADSRRDWDRVRVGVMRWCLRVKLAQNWEAFSALLERTGDLPIVEESRRDTFWGAKPTDQGQLVGMNILGRLLMELRGEMREGGREAFRSVMPPSLSNFRLLNAPVGTIVVQGSSLESDIVQAEPSGKASPPSASERPRRDSDLVTLVRAMVRERPVSRQELNAALIPRLPASLPEREKRRRIKRQLQKLRRAGWIAFCRLDRRWQVGDRRALTELPDLRGR